MANGIFGISAPLYHNEKALEAQYASYKITHFLGKPQGPLSSSFSLGWVAGCVVVFAALLVVPVVPDVAFCSAGFTPFSVAAAAAAGLGFSAPPSSHAKLTLDTRS